MAYPDDVTKAYVDLLTGKKYAARTNDSTEFSAVKDMQSQYINPKQFPDKKATHGLALLVAHFYAMDDASPPEIGDSDITRGAITGESVGDASFSYSGGTPSESVSGWKAYLTQTKYGSEYLYLMRTFKCTPMVL
jgi:hypothetical protein